MNNLGEVDKLINKLRNKYVKETTQLLQELENNRKTLIESEKETSQELTDEENNAYVKYLLEEGKRRNEVKLAKPIKIESDLK